ncbi:double-strand break repair helicase AddA [Ponticoccus sp. (in: a-proteobacteria)]|uniref:double-strand break repair helicase AddA n=1 Tax=Ponticoccus sp. (in: a-proteobacteria) TaxID=1925025 RepID=UPI003AB52F98
MIRDEATQRQVDAAEPGNSTWLAANAGSGKTRVLTDRVARLLLEGVDPSHILCLTYTKAAATEMQNRLFRRLGGWAMLAEPLLRDELRALGADDQLDTEALQQARTLFARAIETPGGLRIQTIHSFCAALLRRFPLEAGVSPQFQEMEDRAAQLMRAELLDRMADGPQAGLVHGIAPFISMDDDTHKLLAQIAGMAEDFATPRTPRDIRAAYGLGADQDHAAMLGQVFLGSETDLCAALQEPLKAGGKTDQTLAEGLAACTAPDLAGFAALKSALLTDAGTIRKTLGTKGVRTAHGTLFEKLDQLAARVEGALEAERALACAARDIALHAFAQAFLPAYAAEKERRGWLDFDDLITRARDLLSDPKVADWVLYRLDGGIDHILVDEAQDTSPVQWQVIERLAHEFTSGEGARAEVRRTIFVVGDKKQSIYSFQGADPSEFDRMREDFADRLRRTDAPLVPMTLEFSFRSAEPILRLVDNTFMDAEASGFAADQKHRAFKAAMPGRVDLWPVVETIKEEKPGPWFEPVDRVGQTHATVILARRVAQFVRRTLDAGTPLPVERGHSGEYQARPVHAGDFLILVRSRARLFKEIIRACKQEGIPIAGADRLKVMAELAVRDIIALLRFLATPEDDLSLATLLRSPLFGWSEQALFTLSHGRKGYLWETLRARREAHPETLAVLDDMLGQTDFLRPYDLIERLLTRHRGRRLLIGRLGPEAEDGVNALLQQALAYEQSAVPSLTGFLEWAQADDLQIKRAPDSAGEVLRVMTVHGAKGLEAPIVILPDCAQPDTALRGTFLTDADGPLWKAGAKEQPARQTAAVEAAKLKEAQERDRLLYVALTRAEKWLVVAAAGELGKEGLSWHEKVRRGMQASGAVEQVFDFGETGTETGLRLGEADFAALPLVTHDRPAPESVVLPPQLMTPAPTPERRVGTRSPSDLGGAKALPGASGDTEDRAKLRGTLVHLFLEHLAPLGAEARGAASEPLVSSLSDQHAATFPAEDLRALRDEALTLLSAPALAGIFAADALAEVPVTADLGPLGRVHGVIDRLVVAPDRVLAVDFKTNRTTPDSAGDTPEGLLRQMGAYAAALGQLYPDRRVETAILWTCSGQLMPLPHDLVTAALQRAALP